MELINDEHLRYIVILINVKKFTVKYKEIEHRMDLVMDSFAQHSKMLLN